MTSIGENALPVEGKPEITESQLRYGTINYAHSQKKTAYKYFMPGTGSATNRAVALVVGNVTQTDIEIPAGVFSLAKSYMEYDLNIPSQPAIGGQNSAVAVFNDAVDFDSVQLLNSRSSVLGVDARYANKMVNSMVKAEIPFKDWIVENEDYKPLVPSNVVAGNVPSTGGAAPTVAGTAQIRTDINNAATTFVNYLEPASLNLSAVMASAQANFATFHRRVPLSIFKRTLFALDKVIPFPEKSILRLNWAGLNNLGFSFRGADQLTIIDTAAALTVGNGLPANRYHIENFRLVLYQEADADVNRELMTDAASDAGMKITIPYVTANKVVQTAAGTLHTVVADIGTSMGFNLQRIYVVPYVQSGTTTVANNQIGFYNHSQLNAAGTAGGAKVQAVQTFLNQNAIQPAALDPTWPQRETLNWVKEVIKGSLLSVSPKYFDYQYMHIDAFDALNPNVEKLEGKYEKDELLTGVPIVAKNEYEFRANGQVALDYYVFICTQRTLRIAKGEWTVDSQA